MHTYPTAFPWGVIFTGGWCWEAAIRWVVPKSTTRDGGSFPGSFVFWEFYACRPDAGVVDFLAIWEVEDEAAKLIFLAITSIQCACGADKDPLVRA